MNYSAAWWGRLWVNLLVIFGPLVVDLLVRLSTSEPLTWKLVYPLAAGALAAWLRQQLSAKGIQAAAIPKP